MRNVHTEHCCVVDGCKFSDLDCPVWLGIREQTYKCEKCPVNFTKPDKRTVAHEILLKRREELNLSQNY